MQPFSFTFSYVTFYLLDFQIAQFPDLLPPHFLHRPIPKLTFWPTLHPRQLFYFFHVLLFYVQLYFIFLWNPNVSPFPFQD
jgi:hypothetical protein